MLIRRADLDDLDAVVKLRLELLREVGNLRRDAPAARLAEATRRYLADKMPKGEFAAWVAEVDDEIVGISGLVITERPPLADNLSGVEGYVLNMYTIPECRGRGIAAVLLDEIIDFAKGTDARRVWLHATPVARSIYEKAGFVPRSAGSRTSAVSEMELVW